MAEPYLREGDNTSHTPFKKHSIVLQGLVLYVVMCLNFEQIVRCFPIIHILTLEDSYVGWIPRFLLAKIVITKVTTSLSVFQSYHIS